MVTVTTAAADRLSCAKKVHGTGMCHVPVTGGRRIVRRAAIVEPSDAGPSPKDSGNGVPRMAGLPPKALGQNNIIAKPTDLVAPSGAATMVPMDGNEGAARIAYALSNVSFIYPITPSTPMGELADQWAADGKKNAFGNIMSVTEMESETGAAGGIHGALSAGSLATTFTCSQGLLLMIPNMYKIAGELSPCVIHVTARAIAKHALSIFGDHQDVMAVRQTGWGMLCSHSVQEAHDLALAAHLATLRSSVPFVHFFDGFRTSHEINKVSVISDETVKAVIQQPFYQAAIAHHAHRGLNPTHPHQRGTAQGPDVYFQNMEAANPFYDATPGHVLDALAEVTAITGRPYGLFDYVGHPEADRVIVIMGSGSQIAEEGVHHLNAIGQKVGVVKVRLFRPWSAEHLLAAIPTTAHKLCVLDRTKESGAQGDPLFQDVIASIAEHEEMTGATGPRTVVIGGRYGMGSKEFTPAMVVAAFDNLNAPKPKRRFTVGIVDDVTNSHLPVGPTVHTLPVGTQQCMFWGMGSDGTVGANKEAIKIIADATDLYAQAYFAYDAHKSGGVTVSHLRFGPQPIGASYCIEQADYMAVAMQSYMHKFDTLAKLRPGGTLVLNTVHTSVEALDAFLPARVKRQLAQLQPAFYVIDARAVADSVGLGKFVNMVMQTVFFSLSNVLPIEKAIGLLKKSIVKAYTRKGPAVVEKNTKVVDLALESLVKITVPAEWASAEIPTMAPNPDGTWRDERLSFIENVARPMLAMEGDALPVSVFSPQGFTPPGTAAFERRAIAATIPIWKSENCTQCNICSFVCPHAAIRPFLAMPGEVANAPEAYTMLAAKGPGLGDYKYRMQVAPYDCTGCQLCVSACPDNALVAQPIDDVLSIEDQHWSFSKSLPVRTGLMDTMSVKGSQLAMPYLEFSGACEGCGETPYVKLLTQLFGERLVIANATGCSSIWGGSAPSNPYTTNEDGWGPAWANSLFEDNAQYGLGIAMGIVQRRATLRRNVGETLALGDAVPMSAALRDTLSSWHTEWQNVAPVAPLAKAAMKLLAEEGPASTHPALKNLHAQSDMFVKPSIWIIGGDGWAYDIGFGGLDHVISTGEDVNILVLDTEMYSNTGGQKSKSTPLGAVAKFAAGGKSRPKKDLGAVAMGYGDVYVASCNLEANYGQVVRALVEAEKYPGASLTVCYSTCVMQGIDGGMCNAIRDAKEATASGYWPLYRYNPLVHEDGTHHRFQLDSKKVKYGTLEHFLHGENRFSLLERKDPDTAARLHRDLELLNEERYNRYKHLTENDVAHPNHPMSALEDLDAMHRADTEIGPGGGDKPGRPSHFT
ncbi:hypothetical protein FOA52_003725 [Chlamydomonas sp. UWO 241]|nr:hypothetical protein FOA52_003725 [Chlamydomonas sp. UWO 241]